MNDLVITGGRITVSVAHDWTPVPPFEDVGVTQLFPVEVPVTVKERVQPVTGKVTPESITDEVVTAGVTPQVFVTGVRLESWIPAGKVSVTVKPTPVNATAFGFVTTKLKVLVPPAAIGVGLNDFVITGGRITVSVAHDWAPRTSI